MNVIILGASARAAAFSAHRAGLRPWCVDCFGDEDLARVCPVRRVPLSGYPDALVDALADAPDGPVLYTGGLENYPDLIARIDRPLWGNSPGVVRRVRDPFQVADALRRHGLPVLEVRREPPAAGLHLLYLRKPLRGSGGIGTRPYDGRPFDPATHYLQAYASGGCIGANFLGMPGRGALLLGVSWPLAVNGLYTPPFHYRGSLVRREVDRWNLDMLGDILVREFGLTGLFGIDAVVSDDTPTGITEVRVLEVNPRYTASMEVLERVCGRSLLALHRAVFERQAIVWQSPARWPAVVAKAVVYARDEVVFSADGPWRQAFDELPEVAGYADIPHAGEVIPRGGPVLTAFGAGATLAECVDALRHKVQALDRHLYRA
jgi:predicted ATP-grasp superfamily ATP-dependent carboligase